jgi:hypothetical protein
MHQASVAARWRRAVASGQWWGRPPGCARRCPARRIRDAGGGGTSGGVAGPACGQYREPRYQGWHGALLPQFEPDYAAIRDAVAVFSVPMGLSGCMPATDTEFVRNLDPTCEPVDGRWLSGGMPGRQIVHHGDKSTEGEPEAGAEIRCPEEAQTPLAGAAPQACCPPAPMGIGVCYMLFPGHRGARPADRQVPYRSVRLGGSDRVRRGAGDVRLHIGGRLVAAPACRHSGEPEALHPTHSEAQCRT